MWRCDSGRAFITWPERMALGGLLLFVIMAARAGASADAKPDASIGGLKAKFVDVKGVKTRYYEMGQGEPLVMIHGGSMAGSSTANVFSRNIPGLAKRFHVFAVDRLASGMTGNPLDDKDYNYASEAEFIYQLIQTLKLGAVHLVGHSAGGGIAFYMAIEHPEAVKTLVIIAAGPEDPSAIVGPTKLDAALPKCPDQSQYEGLKCRVTILAWLPNTFDEEYWEADAFMARQAKTKEARAKLIAGAGEPLRTKEFPAYREKMFARVRDGGVLQMPVLLYAGKNDVLDWGANDPAAMLQRELALFDILAAKNSKVRMIIQSNSGHFMYREYPEQFNQDLISFMSGSGGSDPGTGPGGNGGTGDGVFRSEQFNHGLVGIVGAGGGSGPSVPRGGNGEIREEVFHPGRGGVGFPVCVYCRAPEFSKEARKAKLDGSVILQVIIQADGSISDAHVTKSLGMGLDEKALEAVRKWRFTPATGPDGKPVRVVTEVEVVFKYLK